jgi:hypothetical protein
LEDRFDFVGIIFIFCATTGGRDCDILPILGRIGGHPGVGCLVGSGAGDVVGSSGSGASEGLSVGGSDGSGKGVPEGQTRSLGSPIWLFRKYIKSVRLKTTLIGSSSQE